MTDRHTQIFNKIKTAIENAPRNQYTAELHIQMIKYGDELKDIKGREFCELLGVSNAYATEFNKMLNIIYRLKKAKLNTSLL